MIATNVPVPTMFAGMSFNGYPSKKGGGTPTPAPTYRYGSTRLHVCGLEWYDIETSDGVFNWTRCDELIDTFYAQGKEIIFQIYGTPAFHAQGLWATVPDNNEQVPGAMCQAPPAKLQRFVTEFVKRYNTDLVRNNGGARKVAGLIPKNEIKFDGPIMNVVFDNAAKTGTISVGDTVIGVTTGVSGVVKAVSINGASSYLQVQLPVGSAPFGATEVVQKDVNNKVTSTGRRCKWYGILTAQEAATDSRLVWQAAKAVDPLILIGSPDWTIEASEANYILAWANASDGAGGTGKLWADFLGWHPYNGAGTQVTDRLGYLRSIMSMMAYLKDTMAQIGVSWPVWFTEWGYTAGWAGIDVITQQDNRAKLLRQTAAVAAAVGAQRMVAFQSDDIYVFNPSLNTVIASAFDDIGSVLPGAVLKNVRITSGDVEFYASGKYYRW